MALIESRTGKPIRPETLFGIYDALVFVTSMVCDPKQRRLCEWMGCVSGCGVKIVWRRERLNG